MSIYENKGPCINSQFSFNIDDFLKTYNVPGMILGGGDQIMIETQSLLSQRPQRSVHGLRKKNRAEHDGGGRSFLFYGAVRAGRKAEQQKERTFEQKPQGQE